MISLKSEITEGVTSEDFELLNGLFALWLLIAIANILYKSILSNGKRIFNIFRTTYILNSIL